MSMIEKLEETKQGFQKLTYKDNIELDRLRRRLKMLIKNYYSSNSSYLADLKAISYSVQSYSSGVPESKKNDAWISGKSNTVNLIDTIIEEQRLFPNTEECTDLNYCLPQDNNKVFIVHGHDNEAKTEVARFVERLGLEAIILHERPSSGDTIIEKLEKYTDVSFAIVLYTPDDIGVVKSDANNPKPRARQNVVFEHGLLIGKIGRKNVVALVKDKVEIPNDISGVVYETMDSKGAWKYHVAKELKASSYTIDMNAI